MLTSRIFLGFIRGPCTMYHVPCSNMMKKCYVLRLIWCKFSPNQVFTPNFTYRWVTHIVLLSNIQPLFITFLHNLEGGEPFRRGGCVLV